MVFWILTLIVFILLLIFCNDQINRVTKYDMFLNPQHYAMKYYPNPDNDMMWRQRYVNGQRVAKHSTLIIGGLLRDVGDIIPIIQHKIYQITPLFQDYKIVLMENDSSDNTRALLMNWHDQDDHVIVYGCGVNQRDPCEMKFTMKSDSFDRGVYRMKKMVHLRNTLLNYIKTLQGDYVLMWDLDGMSIVFPEGVCSAVDRFDRDSTLSAVCANGFRYRTFLPAYFDCYAHIDINDKPVADNSLSHLSNDIVKIFTYSHHTVSDPPLQVDSCFGGCTLYRHAHLLPEKVQYDSFDEKGNIYCEHTGLCKTLKKKIVDFAFLNLIIDNR
jgi:hypothetical protein